MASAVPEPVAESSAESAEEPAAESVAETAAAMELIRLPLDVLTRILSELSVPDLLTLVKTCRYLRDLILKDNFLWRQVTRKHLIIFGNIQHRCSHHLYSYYNKVRISYNWTHGIYKERVVIFHPSNYMPWLYYDYRNMYLSVGRELRCYNTDYRGVPMCRAPAWRVEVPTVRRNDIRTNDITRFTMKGGLVACGNRDGCVAIYSHDFPDQRPRLLHHIQDCHDAGQSEVSAVEIIADGNAWCVVTASQHSSTVMMWGLRPDHPYLNGYTRDHEEIPFIESRRRIKTYGNTGVRCLAVCSVDERLAMGLAGNTMPLLLDFETGEMLLTADNTKCLRQSTRDICWHNYNTLAFVTHAGLLRMVDTRIGGVVYQAEDPFLSSLYCLKSDGHNAILAGSGEYSRCVLYDTRMHRRHAQMYFTQKKSSPVYCLDFDASKLIAAADQSVGLLNFNVNRFNSVHKDYSHTFEVVRFHR